MNKLRVLRLLKEADEAYYSTGSLSGMTDAEYDELKNKVRILFPDDPYFKAVGAEPVFSGWKIQKHSIPMGSIDNLAAEPNDYVNSVLESCRKWWEGVGKPVVVLQYKIDGLSINLEYQEDLIAAILRGDGVEGEDLFKNAFNAVPPLVAKGISNIRGEIIISKKNFDTVNILQEKAGEKPYANCRNAAAGIIRRLDGKYSNFLTFVPFDVVFLGKQTEGDVESYLGGVESVWAKSFEEIKAYYLAALKGREELPYEIDGVVVKVDRMDLRDHIGGDKMRPDWIRAAKFPPEERLFKVDDIRWFVGKTGKVTPVLHSHVGTQFKDKVVHEATLHNYAYFCRLKIAPGDKVTVAIAGDVIPKVGDVAERAGAAMFPAPKECPMCKSLLRVDETFLWCDAEGCLGRAMSIINAHVKEMGIDGVGPELIEKLYIMGQANKIKFSGFPDLYSLTERDLLMVEGFAAKSAARVLSNIRARMEPDLATFVASLGIPGVGAKTIEKIGAADYGDLMLMKEADFKKINGVGEKLAKQLQEGLAKTYQLAGAMLARGVKIKTRKRGALVSNKLGGKSYCFTGDIKEINPDSGKPWTREEAWALVEANGGVVKTGVSKKVDVLVLADMSSMSSKARKAREYGMELISVGDFLRRILYGDE